MKGRLRRGSLPLLTWWYLTTMSLCFSCWTDFFASRPLKTTTTLCMMTIAHAAATTVVVDDDEENNEFVQQVLDENDWRHNDQDGLYSDNEDPETHNNDNDYQERLRHKHEEEEEEARLKQQQAQAERMQRQKAEEAFARELEAADAEQQKLLRRKRQQDGKIVQRILHAWQRKDYFAVLGLRWFFPEGIRLIPGRGTLETSSSSKSNKPKTKLEKIKQIILKLQWPDWVVLRLSTRDIQQAYRMRAVQVHPDKNRDPRTEQAFVAVQDAHAVLVDPVLRKEYEQERRQHRMAVRQAWMDRYHKLVNTTVRPLWIVVHKVVGPMTVPIVVIGALVF